MELLKHHEDRGDLIDKYQEPLPKNVGIIFVLILLKYEKNSQKAKEFIAEVNY